MAIRGSAPLNETSLFGEYPFLPGAASLAGPMAVSMRELLESAAFERARTIGRARIRAALDDPRGSLGVEELARAAPEERFLSFLFARTVLSSAASPAPLRRWSVAEAKGAYVRLGKVPLPELLEVARRLGYPLEARDGAHVSIDLVGYLRLAVPIREADFRLASQPLHRGRVALGRDRAARLLQEAIRIELARPAPATEELREAVRTREAEILAEIARRTPAPVARAAGGPTRLRPERFPPCIRKMRRALEAGENLSHSGRFALAAFLHRSGADAETIVDAYRGAPDFEESITRYQVEHITLHDDGRGYEPPECATLRSHGLCARDGDPSAADPIDRVPDPRCFEPTLRHPLQYYRLRGGEVMEVREERTGAPGPPTPPDPKGRGRPAGRGGTPSTGSR